MQLKILFILTLTRHVSAAGDHHQVFLLKLFHCYSFLYLVLLMYTFISLLDVLSHFFQHKSTSII
jgi:hypothetical protein